VTGAAASAGAGRPEHLELGDLRVVERAHAAGRGQFDDRGRPFEFELRQQRLGREPRLEVAELLQVQFLRAVHPPRAEHRQPADLGQRRRGRQRQRRRGDGQRDDVQRLAPRVLVRRVGRAGADHLQTASQQFAHSVSTLRGIAGWPEKYQRPRRACVTARQGSPGPATVTTYARLGAFHDVGARRHARH
jgi:hypothetical protein